MDRADLVSIIVPTLNEADNVRPLVEQILESRAEPLEIIFVDDGSIDGTCERIRQIAVDHPVRLIEREEAAFGLSGAVIAGAKYARGDRLVVMDADLSHPPARIPDLLRALNSQDVDLVIGSRYVSGGSTPGWPLWRKFMSRVAAALAFPLTGVHDAMCGFFATRRDLLLELASGSNGFKIVFEMMIRGGGRLRAVEVPILFRDRARGSSKMSFGVALVFFFRWLVAIGTVITRERLWKQSTCDGELARRRHEFAVTRQ